MKSKYSQAFREQAIQKLLQRGDKTIQCIAEELNINGDKYFDIYRNGRQDREGKDLA